MTGTRGKGERESGEGGDKWTGVEGGLREHSDEDAAGNER